MDFDSVIRKRKSVRKFKARAPSWRYILEAIDAASQGAFAGNINNLKFLIVEDPDTIKKLASYSQQSWISESKILIVVCSDDSRLENMYGERGRIYSRQQAGAAVETIILKLTDLGIDSCWVGAYTDELIKQCLKIPQHIQIEAIIPTGYEEPPAEKKARKKELEKVLMWEKWGKTKRPPLFAEKDNEPPI